jgi:hypothetical protein
MQTSLYWAHRSGWVTPPGHAQRVLESLDASLGETDPDGRMVSVER